MAKGSASVMEPAARTQAQRSIESARLAAIRKHGPLQGGMLRWVHHLREECEEACAEMYALDHLHSKQDQWDHRVALLTELAQVAQLAQSMMVMLYLNQEQEGAETWAQAQAQDQTLEAENLL
jgi:hypothetical protein